MMKRISTIFRAKANSALDKAEDPRETLDYSYQRQLEMLTKVRRGVADVATSRKRIELQRNQLQSQSDKLTAQAQKAHRGGPRGPRPRGADPQVGADRQIADLDAQHSQLQGEEEKLTLASQRLQAKVESFRTRKETIKANYTAAEAQTRIGEAFSGISEEMGDVGMAVQRAEDKTQQMQARAGAIDELIASGALDDASSINSGDDISRELEAMSSQSDVEAELAALKGSTPAGDRRAPETPGSVEDTPTRGVAAGEGTAGMIVRILGEGQLEVADDQLDIAQRARRARSRRRSRPGTRPRSAPPWPLSSTACAAPAARSPRTPSTTPTSSSRRPTPRSTRSAHLLEGDGLIPG